MMFGRSARWNEKAGDVTPGPCDYRPEDAKNALLDSSGKPIIGKSERFVTAGAGAADAGSGMEPPTPPRSAKPPRTTTPGRPLRRAASMTTMRAADNSAHAAKHEAETEESASLLTDATGAMRLKALARKAFTEAAEAKAALTKKEQSHKAIVETLNKRVRDERENAEGLKRKVESIRCTMEQRQKETETALASTKAEAGAKALEVEALKQELAACQDRLSSAETAVGTMSQQAESMKSANAQLQSELLSIKEELAASQAACTKLSKELEEAAQQHAGKLEELRQQMDSEAKKAVHVHDAKLADVRAEHQARVSVLETTLEHQEAAYKQLEATVAKNSGLAAKVETLTSQLEATKKELEATEAARAKELHAIQDSFEKDREAIKDSLLEACHKEVDKAQLRHAEAEAAWTRERTSLKGVADSFIGRLKSANDKIQDLEEKLSDTGKQLRAAESHASELKHRMDAALLAQSDAKAEALEQLSALAKQLEAKTTSSEAATLLASELREAVQAKAATIKELQTSVDSLQLELRRSKVVSRQSKKQLAASKGLAAKLRAELVEVRSDAAGAAGRAAVAETALAALQQQLGETRESAKAQADQFQVVQGYLARSDAELRESKAQLEAYDCYLRDAKAAAAAAMEQRNTTLTLLETAVREKETLCAEKAELAAIVDRFKAAGSMDELLQAKYRAEELQAMEKDALAQANRLAEETGILAGHRNTKQKVHYVMQLKKENVHLKNQVARLQSRLASAGLSASDSVTGLLSPPPKTRARVRSRMTPTKSRDKENAGAQVV